MIKASEVQVGMHFTIDHPVGTPGARVLEILEIVEEKAIRLRRVAYRWISPGLLNDPSKPRWTNLDVDQELSHWYTDDPLPTIIEEIPV